MYIHVYMYTYDVDLYVYRSTSFWLEVSNKFRMYLIHQHNSNTIFQMAGKWEMTCRTTFTVRIARSIPIPQMTPRPKSISGEFKFATVSSIRDEGTIN